MMRLVDIQLDYHDYSECDSGTGTSYYSVTVQYWNKHDTFTVRRTFTRFCDVREFLSNLQGVIEAPATEVIKWKD